MRLVFHINLNVIFQPFDVKDAAQLDLHQLVFAFDENRFGVGLCRVLFGRRYGFCGGVRELGFGCLAAGQLVPAQGFVGRLEEVGIADGFEQIVEGIDLIAVEGVLAESGGEDDARIGIEDT